jgi:hypothetical protein
MGNLFDKFLRWNLEKKVEKKKLSILKQYSQKERKAVEIQNRAQGCLCG